MADLIESQQSELVRITGKDESFPVDTVFEKGFNKLYVKASVAPQILGNLAFEYVKNGTNENMKVDGSTTPVVFTFENTTANDLIVNSMQFECECSSPSAAGFAGGSSLTNGVVVGVKSEDVSFDFKPIRKNYEFDSLFAQGSGGSFLIYSGAGNDYIGAKFSPASPFILKKTGTYASNDRVTVTINDNLSGSAVASLKLIIFGAYDA